MTMKQKSVPVKKKDISVLISAAIIVAIYVLVFVLEQIMPSTSMLFTVLKKGAVYALVAVSMNLLNGFTGLFSLGQAGFMLIGAYAYGILTIPVTQRAAVYQYYDGGIVQFAMPVIPALILAGLVAAVFAFLIGLPVLDAETGEKYGVLGEVIHPGVHDVYVVEEENGKTFMMPAVPEFVIRIEADGEKAGIYVRLIEGMRE